MRGCSGVARAFREEVRLAISLDRRPRGRVRGSRGLVGLGLCLVLLLSAPGAFADEYDSQRAGHPLRVAAYVLHPVGVVLDWLIFRPAHWVGSHEPFRTLSGHTDDH